jgi:hypothetical protein
MKRILCLLALPLFIMLSACDPKDISNLLDDLSGAALTDADISKALKEALQLGVDNSVRQLSATDGFYSSSYKILLPDEANVVIDKLKFIPGLATLEEEMLRRINRAAEDAATKAAPIFLDAVKSISFDDAMNILMGEKNAATMYLNDKTYTRLYDSFKPVLVNSLNKFGALDYWSDAVGKYNALPFVKEVNPDLADHINNKALYALFDLIEEKELGIRQDINQRTSELLRKVFARQDS